MSDHRRAHRRIVAPGGHKMQGCLPVEVGNRRERSTMNARVRTVLDEMMTEMKGRFKDVAEQ